MSSTEPVMISQEMMYLFGSVVILLVVLFVQSVTTVLANGLRWGLGPRDVPAKDDLFAGRAKRTVQNHMEGLALFAIVNIATWKFRSLARPGLNAGLFLLSYGLFRALLETVREPDAHMPEALRGYVTMGMLLSLPMIAAGIWLIHRALKTPQSAKG